MAVNIPEKRRESKPKEKSKGRKGLRVNYLIIFLSGLLILFAGVLAFLLIVKNVYGNYEISEILPTKENLEKIAYEDKAAILYPQYTENRLEEGSTWVQDNISTWETYFDIIKMKYDIISDFDIEAGKFHDYKLLILPGAQSLSDREIIQLKKYLDNGGSIFSTGGPATFSDDGKWRGWDFFTEVFGLKFTKELDDKEKFKVHTLRGNLPLTAEIPTGYSLQIATWDRPIYAEILEPRVTQVSFWYDYRKEAGLVREEIQKSAGIAYGAYGKGRFVWFGFQLNSVIGRQEDYIFFEKLFRNSVNWLLYKPTSYVKDWPSPYKAAAIITPVMTDAVGNINNLIEILQKYDYQATYFIDPYDIERYKSFIRRTSNVGTLGVISDIGYIASTTDTVNKLFDKTVQLETIKFAVDSLDSVLNKRIKGLMPYYGFYDENTLQAMSALNMEFLVTDSLTDRSVPKLEIRDGKPILIITKTARDDKEIVEEYGLVDTDFQFYTYEEDIDRLLFEGGLYVLKLHTNLQLQPQFAAVVNDIIKDLRKKEIWVTSIPELMQWWRKKGGLEIRYDTRSKRRITVEVSNPRDTNTEDFVVQVHLNKKVRNIEISSDIINTKIPDFQFDEATNTLFLYIDELDSGETRIYLVDFENVNV